MKQTVALFQAEEKQTLETMKNTFIRSVQHELRTPVSIILGYADLLESGALGSLDQKQQQAVETIAGQAVVLRGLVERITTLIDLESDEIIEQPMTVNDIVLSVTETQQDQAIQAGVALTTQLAPDLPLISGNPDHLKQAIECLVENGLKFTPAGGQVSVTAEVKDNWVYLTVTDTGIGITEDKLEYIFDTFYQINGSNTRPYNGLGLGLAVTKAVVKAYGGEIAVDSGSGQGSHFTLKLPAFSDLTSAIKYENPKRILIVDDEAFVTFTLQEGLEKLPNCEIITASNGQQALQFFEQQSFDLLITDYRMPDIDGITLAAQIRQKHPHLATILITAYGDSILRNHGANVPIQHILDKPVKLADIRNLTTEMLAGQSFTPNHTYVN